MNAKVRQFDSGATRNLDDGKFDYEGFLSPLVLERYAQYMHKHRQQADGSLRDSDNWQKGIPRPVYIKSAFRHFLDWWKEHREIATVEGLEDAICALMFNAGGYLHEHLKAKAEVAAIQQWPAPSVWVSREESEEIFQSGTIHAHIPSYDDEARQPEERRGVPRARELRRHRD